MMILQWLKLDT